MRLLRRSPAAGSRAPGRPRETRIPGRPPVWQRRWLRHRRPLAAALVGVVVWSVTTTVRPPAPETRLVVTARHDLAAGATLGPDDLLVAPRAVAWLPVDAVTDPDDLQSRLVAAPVVAGEVVRGRDVVGRSLLARLGPDLVATPVRLGDDAVLAGLRPGDVVDVVAARGGDGTVAATASVVAARVRVLTVGPAPGTSGGLLGGAGPSGSSTPVLLLATTSVQALDIAAASVGARLSVTLRSA